MGFSSKDYGHSTRESPFYSQKFDKNAAVSQLVCLKTSRGPPVQCTRYYFRPLSINRVILNVFYAQDESFVRSTFVAQPFVAKGLVVVNFKLFENRLKTILAGKLLCIHSCLQKNLCFRDIFERYTYVLTSTMILMIKNKSYKVT